MRLNKALIGLASPSRSSRASVHYPSLQSDVSTGGRTQTQARLSTGLDWDGGMASTTICAAVQHSGCGVPLPSCHSALPCARAGVRVPDQTSSMAVGTHWAGRTGLLQTKDRAPNSCVSLLHLLSCYGVGMRWRTRTP